MPVFEEMTCICHRDNKLEVDIETIIAEIKTSPREQIKIMSSNINTYNNSIRSFSFLKYQTIIVL